MIDIIVPTFKPASYIEEFFDSLENQELSKKYFLVTVILNGDKEPYYSYLIDILQKYSFRYNILYSGKASVSHARNLGLESTCHQYICFIDDDDVITSNYLSSFLSIANDKNIIVSNVLDFFNQTTNNQKDYLYFAHKFESKNLIKYRKYLSNSCCKLIPRKLIGNTRFNLTLANGEDALFMFTLSDGIEKIISTNPDVIYYRRMRAGSASRKKLLLKELFYIMFFQQVEFTKVYLNNMNKYSFLLYLTRILAISKVFISKFKG